MITTTSGITTTLAWWWTYSMPGAGTIVYNCLYDGSMIAKVMEWIAFGLFLTAPALMIFFSALVRWVSQMDDERGDGK